MAATTISAIIERFEKVLTSPPLNLTISTQPFGDDVEGNAIVDAMFRVVSGGMVGQRSQSNYAEARMDRVTVTLQQKLRFDGYQAQRDLTDLADDVVRAMIADGLDYSYDVTEEKGSRKIVHPKKTDICRMDIGFICDYDWNEA